MSLTSQRPDPAGRCFASDAVEDVIRDVASRVADAELAWLFSNCFPNTLDTTVTPDGTVYFNGRPLTDPEQDHLAFLCREARGRPR